PSPGAATPARGSSRGVAIEDDPARWDLWWEFRKDPYLRLRDHVHGGANDVDALLGGARPHGQPCMPPTRDDVDRDVVPALAAALADAADRDTITGCLVALAKIGRGAPGIPLSQLFRQHLVSHDQEVRETAALCFGIARTTAAADHDLLLALALDTP